jgi:hypothetical protein
MAYGFLCSLRPFLQQNEATELRGLAVQTAVAANLKPGEKLNITVSENPNYTSLKKNDEVVQNLNHIEVVGDLFHGEATPDITNVVAKDRAVVFNFSLIDFYFVMASQYDLAQGLIPNVNERKTEIINS